MRLIKLNKKFECNNLWIPYRVFYILINNFIFTEYLFVYSKKYSYDNDIKLGFKDIYFICG